MIPFGKPCPICGKRHIIKPIKVWDDLSPKEKTKGYQTNHRIFGDGYYRSYDKDGQIWEFYLPLTVHKMLIVKESEKELERKRSEPFYGKTEYEKWQLLDEDDYED